LYQLDGSSTIFQSKTRLMHLQGPKSPEEAQAAHTRRREQVRRAQRYIAHSDVRSAANFGESTHRERKEKYVRNLEVEVTKLREQDAAHAQAIENFKQKIRHLHNLLTSNGIAIPAHLLLSQTPSPQASIAVVNNSDGSQGIRATMPVIEGYQQQVHSPGTMTMQGYENQNQQSPGTRYQSATHSASENTSSQGNIFNLEPSSTASTSASPFSDTLRTDKSRQNFHPSGLDAAQVAVDFVLALESPCLSHHPNEPSVVGDEPSGHSLMLQSPIMARVPAQLLSHTGSGKQQFPSNLTWNVPAQEIEKLLDLSAKLSLEGEITPIEAWQRIRGHPHFALLDIDRLDALKNMLVGEVKCYG
jgi:hypothetical protein